MTTIDKKHVENAIKSGDTGEAIKMMLAILQANNGSDYDNVVLQSARWHGLQRDKLSGTISFSNAAMVTAQITSTVTHYAGNLKTSWTAQYELKDTGAPNTPAPTSNQTEATQEEAPPSKKIILCLSANPTNSDRLATDIEVREIRDSVRNGRGRGEYSVVYETAVSIKDFRRAVLVNEPAIIHFSGHGTAEGEIILHNSSDKGKKVSAEALGAFFEIIAEVAPVECVVLNACYSEIQAKAIAKSVDYVMGMNNAVPDKTAIGFAQTLYQVLADGRDYELAFKFAKNNIMLEGHSGRDLPIMVRKED